MTVVDGPSARLVDDVRAGQLDLCVAYDVKDYRGCIRHELLRDPTVLVQRSRAGASKERTITLRGASRYPLALPSEQHAFRRLIAEHAARSGVELNVAFDSQSLPVVRELVETGSAAALLPFSAVARDAGHRRLSVRRLVEPDIVQTVWLYQADGRALSPIERELEEIIRQTLIAESRHAERHHMRGSGATRRKRSKPSAQRKAS